MSWFSRLLNVFRRDRLNRDLDEEIQFHLEARIEDLTRGGMSPRQAREQAGRQLGNALLLRESSGDIKLFSRLESILSDALFGLRLCRKNYTVTAAAVISLGLAIGACTAAFSLIDALILRPLPVHDPEGLVHIAYRAPADTQDSYSSNYPLFERLREAGKSHIQLFGMSDQSRREAVFDDAGGQPEQIYGQGISGDAFSLLGVQPALGRLLTASDDQRPDQHPVAVVSYDFWLRRFNGNPTVLGRWVKIRGKHLQIVGVAEKGFTGVEPGVMTDLWAPNMMWDAHAISDAGTRWFRIWGRLQSGAAPDETRALLQTVVTRFGHEQAALRRADEPLHRIERLTNTSVYLRPGASGASGLRQHYARALWILASVAVLVLLIACANVAGLLVARAAVREREMALRISIGAGRGRLIQQLLIESALLSIASCVTGVLIAVTAAPQIVSMLSTTRSQVRLDLQLDWRMLAFLAGMGTLVTFLFGLAPALRASAVSPSHALKSGGGKQTARIGLFRPLIAAQTAFGFMVLFVAGLCLASFAKLLGTDPGFDANDLAIVRVEAGEFRDGGPKALAAWVQLVEHVKQMPGIESASLSGWGLFEGRGRNKSLRIPGRAVDSEDPWYLPVSPRFVETMRIGLAGGRDFEWRDAQPETPSAVIVNQSFARRYFPGESPLGKRFSRVDGSELVTQEIVGIARDAKYTSIRGTAPPTVYDPFRPAESASLQIRTQMAGSSLIALLREELPRVHPAFRMVDLTMQSALIDNTLTRDRALALLSAFFSVVVIVLVAVGLYGVLSYSVVQRTREIGIRLALGARPTEIAGMVVSEIGVVTALGLGLGLAGGIAASRFVIALLYEVKASDLWSIAGPLTCLLLACALPALFPALRAARVDPMTALRHE